MEQPANPALQRAIASALDWWREAGVDLAFRDDPAALLADAPAEPAQRSGEPAPARTAAPTPAPPGEPQLDLSAMPEDLAAFRSWWMDEPALDGGRTQGRVPPRGPAGAHLMILVPDPEPGDADQLLSGAQGRLVEGFLGAAGIAPDAVYFASVLPRATPLADWRAAAAAGFGKVLARHVALVRPQLIVAFDGSSLPLTGNDWPNSPDSLRRFNHEGLSIPLLAAKGLSSLLLKPIWKAKLWQGWLDLTREG